MGKGNWLPRNREDARCVYVELLGPGEPAEADEEAGTETATGNDMIEEAYDLFQEHLEDIMPCSFTFTDKHHRVPDDIPLGRDEYVIAYNGLVALTMDSQGEFFHQGIALVLREDTPGFSAYYLDRLADRLFDKLDEYYEVRVRSTAWTCAPYKRTRELATSG